MEGIDKLLGQIPPPLTKVEFKYRPWLIMSQGKVVRYDLRGMSVWRALICSTHTILVEWDTWYLLIFLTILCFITMLIVIASGQATSIQDNGSVTARVQYLMSFVIGGYVTLVVNRWYTLRNTTLGALWGALENLVSYSGYITHGQEKKEELIIVRSDILRYARVVLLLTFQAARGDNNVTSLLEMKYITEDEELWLKNTMIGTRPLMVVMWIWKSFDRLRGYGVNVPVEGRMLIQQNVTAARGGVGATLGVIGCPYPFAYIHIIYWVVQIYLFILAVETGVELAIYTQRTGNGNGAYSTDDNRYTFPSNGYVWYANVFMQTTVQNVVFALFTQGLLKVCDKMQNPFTMEDMSFPELAYDAFIHNNCKAMFGGLDYFDYVNPKPLTTAAVAESESSSVSSETTGASSSHIQLSRADQPDNEMRDVSSPMHRSN